MPSHGLALVVACFGGFVIPVVYAQSCPFTECTIGGYNFSPLYWACNSGSKWQYRVAANDTDDGGGGGADGDTSVFYFNLCNISGSVSPGCTADTAVCRVTGNSGASLGNRSNMTAERVQNGELRLSLTGGQCSGNVLYQTIIYMKCGKSLGSPVVIDVYSCTYYVEWISSVACKNAAAVAKEIPCYLYDLEHRKRDLTPLIKTAGGHRVLGTSDGEKIILNVCRNISSDPVVPGCNGSVCLLDSRGQVAAYGSVDDGTSLLLTSNQTALWLHYSVPSDITSGCAQRSASVTFVCPRQGGSEEPVLLTRDTCDIAIEWQTDYACPSDDLTSSTCELSTRNGDDIDLSPLASTIYNITADKYAYSIGLCGTTMTCNGVTQAVGCQKEISSRREKALGRQSTQLLRYADGELSLRYRDGEKCNNGYSREIVVNFQCVANASVGAPVFDTENNCTYLFDWDTSYACVSDANDKPCTCSNGDKNFDLSRLIRRDRNWQVLQASEGDTSPSRGGSSIFINVCRGLVNDSQRDAGIALCHPGASACLIYANGTAISLGSHVDQPVYVESTSTLELTYTGGSPCGSGRTVESRIRFVCKPGDLGSSPVLVDTSDDGCVYFFEWHTAAACVEVNVSQDGCRVYDENLGIDFSVSSLRQPDNDYAIRVEGKTNYTYYINVCGPLVKPVAGCTGSGACQVAERSGRSYKIGRPSSTLTYSHGNLQLLYSGGDPYNDPAKTPRRTLIVFTCDPDSGLGRPEFMSENNQTYIFFWRTREACLETVVQCMVSAGSVQYDLSSLSRSKFEDNWSVMIGSQSAGQRKVYINVCRPVNYEPSAGCSATAAACIVGVRGDTESPDIRNLGEPTDGPALVGNALILVYNNGETCAGRNMTYSTKIHFICARGKSGAGPRYVNEMSDICQYTFIWEDEAGCPVAADAGGSACSVTDPETGYVFSLWPLVSKTGYMYTRGSETYKLSLCLPFSDDVCGHGAAACLDAQSIGNSSQAQLHLLPSNNLQLVYRGGANEFKTEVHFTCTYGGQEGITSMETVGKTVHIYFATGAVCYPDPVDCFLTDSSGNQYDLTPLSEGNDNWQVYDEKRPNDTYFISVCTPLNRTDDTASCPGGAISACLTAGADMQVNLGYMLSEPVAADSGSIVISLSNGSSCPDGPGQIQTKIKLFCSSTEAGPKFYAKAHCEYVFYWYTPQACPIKTTVGSDCMVVDQLRGIRYDLSSLRNGSGPYSVTGGKYTYLVNICQGIGQGSAVGLCSASTGVCQKTSPIAGFDAGAANSNLTLEGGVLKLNYTGGTPCRAGPRRSTVLVFICDPTTSGAQGPVFINETDCQYWFEWYTSIACAVRETRCTVRLTNGSIYDLSSLSLPTSNYVVDVSTDGNRTYYINVCRNLVYTGGMGCTADATACYKDAITNRYVTVGRVSGGSPVKHLNELPILEYEHGDTCPHDSSQKLRTHIMVFCDPQKLISQPELFLSDDPCNIWFKWQHAAGCAVTPSLPASEQCSIKSSAGHQFDLAPLANLYSVTAGGSTYYFSLCGTNSSTPCANTLPSNGICISYPDNRVLAGSAARLDYRGGVLTMTYDVGTPCSRGGNMSAVITFVCATDSSGRPVYIGNTDDCMFQFTWRTQYACSHEAVSCAVQYGSGIIDLSPLSWKPYFPATSMVDKLSYFVSVCRPLGSIPGVGVCPPGAASCVAARGNIPSQSIGNIGASPTINTSTGRIQLHYASTAACPPAAGVSTAGRIASSAQASTTILFKCSSTGLQGNPVLVSISSSCEYVFEWETSVACMQSSASQTGKDCRVLDSSGHEFDLSRLHNSTSSYTVQAGAFAAYKIRLCGSDSGVELCQGSRCTLLGKDGSLLLQPSGSMLLQYRSNSPCYTGGRPGTVNTSAQILFECDHDADLPGQPSVVYAGTCSPTFLWKTPLACKPTLAEDCVVHFGSDNFDLRPLSRSIGYWSASFSPIPDGKNMIFYINICQTIRLNNSILADVAVALNKSDPYLTTIGLLHTQRVFYDGSNVALGYSQGTFDCGPGPEPKSSARIVFTCGAHIGSPSYDTYDGRQCAYIFKWSTHLVCADDRQEVLVQNGKMVDPVSNVTMDLTSILNDQEIRPMEKRGSEEYTYWISLNGILSASSSQLPAAVTEGLGECADPQTVVCVLSYKDKSFVPKSLGLLNMRKFYLKDGLLQAIVGSKTSCEQTSGTVETIIDFHCDSSVSGNVVNFTYISSSCQYIFDWFTSAVCEETTSGSANAAVDSSTLPPGGPAQLTGGAVAGIVIAAVAIAAAVVIFGVIKLRRRRMSLLSTAGLSTSYGSDSSIGYAQLQSTDDQGSVLNNAQSLGSLRYNDDSDEDLII